MEVQKLLICVTPEMIAQIERILLKGHIAEVQSSKNGYIVLEVEKRKCTQLNKSACLSGGK